MRSLVLLSLITGCAGASAREAAQTPADDGTSTEAVPLDDVETRAPTQDGSADPTFADLCPFADAALGRVARRFARAQVEGKSAPDADEVGATLREEGAPYPWPHAWSLTGRGDLTDDARARIADWLGSFGNGGQRRCGIARETRGTSSAVAAIAVDALADLEPIPGRVRPGSWLALNARLLVPAASAKVIVLGPRGAPRPVPTSLVGADVRARFALDAPGPWLVQVLADVERGPRPVAEALVIAGNAPRAAAFRDPAPGEDAVASADPSATLGAMLASARKSEGLPPLTHDPELARLAAQHAEAQRAARRTAHDLGAGDPEARISAAGLAFAAVAENVAHADSVALAHRALWRSPSHRANLLSTQVDTIGIGVAEDPDGSVWVCELFARRAR
jgi:uncharacterized protein YkwD